MNKKLAPAILLALPLLSMTGPAFAADAASATDGSSVVLQVNEKGSEQKAAETKTEKSEKTEQRTDKKVAKANEKVAKTEQKAADKVAKTEQKADEKGTEKSADKAAEKVAKTEQKAAEKIEKAKEKAGIKDEAPVEETPAPAPAPEPEAPVVTPKTVTISFVDVANNEKLVFANGGSPVLTVTDGDTKTVFEDKDLNGIYGDEEGNPISLTEKSVLTVNLPDGSLLDLITYLDADGNIKEVPAEDILNFDYASLKDGANDLNVFAQWTSDDDEWDIPVMTVAAVSDVSEEEKSFEGAPVRTDNAAVTAQANVVAPTAELSDTPSTGAAAQSDASEMGAAAQSDDSDEYDLQIDLTEPVEEAKDVAEATDNATASNLEGAELTLDDVATNDAAVVEAAPADDDLVIVDEDDAVVDVAEDDTVVVAEGPTAVLADTGAGVAAAGFGGLLALLGAGSLLFRKKVAKADA